MKVKQLMRIRLSWCLFCFLLIIFTGCSMLPDFLFPPDPYPGFTTKTKEVKGSYKVVVENMGRGRITTMMRMDKDSWTYDAIFFDITVQNIGQHKFSVLGGRQFRLITDDGKVISAHTMFDDGGFDGGLSERPSLDLYPGTNKSGLVGFALKKERKPVKLILEGFAEFDLP